MGLTVCCLETRERVRRLSEKTPLNAAAKHVSLRPEASFHKPGFAAAFFAGYLVIGTIVFKYTENYGWRDAFYFSVTTFTTVGYGDLFPTSAAARIFNIFYILVGLSVVATCVGAIVAWAEAEARNRYGDKEKMQKNVKDLTYSLLRHVVALTFILGVGAVWYTVVENASVLDGIYWATITSSTVGYGVYPIGDQTRTFNCFYLILSVTTVSLCLGKIVKLIAAIELQKRVERFAAQPLSHGLIHEIDSFSTDEHIDGSVNRHEFLIYMLTHMGKVSLSEIEEVSFWMSQVEALFEKYDVNGDEQIDSADIAAINAAAANGMGQDYVSSISGIRRENSRYSHREHLGA